jgi:hypothetical protein
MRGGLWTISVSLHLYPYIVIFGNTLAPRRSQNAMALVAGRADFPAYPGKLLQRGRDAYAWNDHIGNTLQ